MIAALVIAGVLAGAGTPAPVQETPSVVDLIKTACVASDMTSDGFRRVADENHWEGLLVVVRGQADIDRINAEPDWELGYETSANARVFMTGPKTRRSMGVECSARVIAPQGDWRSGLGTLASELGLSAITRPINGETGLWAGADGRKLTFEYTATDQMVTVTLSRPLPAESQ